MPLYDRGTNQTTVAFYSKDRFLEAGKNLEIIAGRIVNNEKLCKLLCRNGSDVLTDEVPVSEEEKASVMTNNIITIPVFPKDVNAKNIIAMQITDIIPMTVGLSFTLVFDIICNVETWTLDEYIPRPYAIMNELDFLLSDTKVKSIGPATLLGASSLKISETQIGYTVAFNIGEV